MYQDLWVASDGIITALFATEATMKIYCYETGWAEQDAFRVRLPVTVSSDGAIILPEWHSAMDPEIGEGRWLEPLGHASIWLPDLSDEALAAVPDQGTTIEQIGKWASLAHHKGTTLREEAILLENQ